MAILIPGHVAVAASSCQFYERASRTTLLFSLLSWHRARISCIRRVTFMHASRISSILCSLWAKCSSDEILRSSLFFVKTKIRVAISNILNSILDPWATKSVSGFIYLDSLLLRMYENNVKINYEICQFSLNSKIMNKIDTE